jgi:hypothetical protein
MIGFEAFCQNLFGPWQSKPPLGELGKLSDGKALKQASGTAKASRCDWSHRDAYAVPLAGCLILQGLNHFPARNRAKRPKIAMCLAI